MMARRRVRSSTKRLTTASPAAAKPGLSLLRDGASARLYDAEVLATSASVASRPPLGRAPNLAQTAGGGGNRAAIASVRHDLSRFRRETERRRIGLSVTT